ncbi:hypothetical protein EH223_07780 [candidate division KSB1 bacterium]|nr:hypothetical protein [candidate division KSB1 bacterium]RQW04300.1 MAG: hypothetical protein EH223_07780 [candidate division KSB1 bacterium]
MQQALLNGHAAHEGFVKCRDFVKGWLAHADPETGLIPRNLNQSSDIWNAHDCGADNYSFMVLTAALTDRELYEGRMLTMLESERRLTSRLGSLPDVYSFAKNDFEHPEIDLDRLMFGASEYIKDGLLPLTEWLGFSPWRERLLDMLDDMWRYASVQTLYGPIVSENVEINGEMLQVLSRVFWMTGEKKYLDWAVRLGDYYLLNDHHPTRDFTRLRLRDHGCEIISGLCELYATVHFALPEKKKEYQPHLYEMLERIAQVGRNKHGLFYNVINPQNGEIIDTGIADTFGYTFNGFYTVFLLDDAVQLRNDVLFGLSNLNHYQSFDWERGSADGYADAIEGALNLYNRERLDDLADWIDSEIAIMWKKQQPSGIIEGWHGDGNFARTTLMYCLWKTRGLTIQPWRDDVIWGAAQNGDQLQIILVAKEPWRGTLHFDSARHKTLLNLPFDWPRINQFPEWFTIEKKYNYLFEGLEQIELQNGATLLEQGLAIQLKANEMLAFSVQQIGLR